jgi:hypothetical protein
VILGNEGTVGVGGNNETWGNGHTKTSHFSEVSALSTNDSDISLVNFLKPGNNFVSHSGRSFFDYVNAK